MLHAIVLARLRGCSCALVALGAMVGSTSRVVQAQWTVIRLHPAGATESKALGVSGQQQVGYVSVANQQHASLWSGTAASWIDLNPPGTMVSSANGISAGQQVGQLGSSGNGARASLWSGTAASWIDLHPLGAAESVALATSGTQQVGYAAVGAYHASSWNGTAASWVDLNPVGAVESRALATSGTQQVGWAMIAGPHAVLWSGTASSWTDLHPVSPFGAVFSSRAGCISDGQQGGGIQVGTDPLRFYQYHAGYWTGTAASWVDLHPGGSGSGVAALQSGYQVGSTSADPDAYSHAAFWHGTAASWVDLHSYLPAAFLSSQATGISLDGTSLHVTGYGTQAEFGPPEALLWSRPICAGDFNRSGGLSAQDILDFLTAWFASDPRTNFNGGVLSVSDIFAFLSAWFAGC